MKTYREGDQLTFYDGAVRIQPFAAPHTLNRSWAVSADIEVPDGGAEGPIAAVSGDLQPDFHPGLKQDPQRHSEARLAHAMLRQ